MADPERAPKLFSLTQAERTRLEVEPVLIEAIDSRRKLVDLDERLSRLASRIHLSGGLQVSYDRAATLRRERDLVALKLKAALERIEATGCLVKDLDVGLLDFPARWNNEEVYWCWRLGEDRIRFWHRQDEGFAGRKPIDPGDPGAEPPIQ